jgi:hypothetical protein
MPQYILQRTFGGKACKEPYTESKRNACFILTSTHTDPCFRIGKYQLYVTREYKPTVITIFIIIVLFNYAMYRAEFCGPAVITFTSYSTGSGFISKLGYRPP